MKAQPVKVTFRTPGDAMVVVLAQLGFSTHLIRVRTGLTESQITYRLHKAKGLEKNKYGYRVAWRNGTSKVAQTILSEYEMVMQKDIQRRLPVLIEHTPAQTVKDIHVKRSR